MHGRSRFRTRARGSGAALSPFLFQASTYGATDAWDFVNDQYIRGGLLSDGGISITRNSVGTAETADGRIVTFSAGELRRTDKGILVEGARTNLFLNSLVGETQTITVTTVAHTLSFYGTGTITLSGASTAGPLVGTGAGQRVTLTFTPTAGSLTLTVSGTVEYVQLEVGAFASSWIPTTDASVQRAADVITAVPTSGTDYPLSLFAEFERVVNVVQNDYIFQVENGTADRIGLLVGSGNTAFASQLSGNVVQATLSVSGALALNTIYKSAARSALDDVNMARGGALSTADTSASAPTSPNLIRFGSFNASSNQLFGYIRTAAIIPIVLTNAQLQEITT